MILQLLGVVILLYCAVLRWKARHKIAFAKNFKNNLKSLPLIGHAYLFIQNKNNVERWQSVKKFGDEALKQGGLTCSWNGHRLYFLVSDPVIAEFVMKNCLEKDEAMKLTLSLIGNGSPVADVPIWRGRRKLLVPSFSQQYLTQFVSTFSNQSMIMMKHLEKVAGSGSLSICKYVTTYTMDSVCETTLGIESHSQEDPNQTVLNAIFKSSRLISDRVTKPWLHFTPLYKLTSEYTEFMKCTDTIYGFIQEVITKKRKAMVTNKDNNQPFKTGDEGRTKTFLELMIESDCDDTVLREESLILFIAGTDTSALATSFTTVLLARHPDVQEKVYRELLDVFGASKRPVKYDDLHHLKYLKTVMKESLRLYPPAPFLLRKADKDVVLPSGLTLPKDTGIFINGFAINRNPQYWGDDADQFRPERFDDGPLKHPTAFMPFSNGPRGCIGYRYAMMSMQTSLATLLRHYRVRPVSDAHLGIAIDLSLDIVLRAADGFQVVLEQRE